MARILVVHPGHGFSTADVYTGLVSGLRDVGADVEEFPYDVVLSRAEELVRAAEQAEMEHPPSAFDLAGAGIPGYALLRDVTHVIVVTGSCVPLAVPMALRKANIKTILLCTESPYETEQRERHMAKLYDVVFTNERRAVPMFDHQSAHYLPHAYNPNVHKPGPADPDKQCDALFIGTGFPERQQLFNNVNWDGIDRRILGTLWGWDYSKEESLDGSTLMGDIPNEETIKWYRSAKININHHRTVKDITWGQERMQHVTADMVESLGPRAYEIAACGGFQLCDDSRAELLSVFEGTVPTYKAGDSADLERQIRYWLAHPDAREQAAKAQHHAVQAHTWTNRASQILDVIL
jgi:spore maturation protein CgeB